MPWWRASRTATGVMITTTGVLLISAEDDEARPVISAMPRRLLAPAARTAAVPKASMHPVRSRAALRTNIDATVTTPGFEKTARTSSVVRIPEASRIAAASSATMSGAMRSRTDATKTAATSTSTATASTVR